MSRGVIVSRLLLPGSKTTVNIGDISIAESANSAITPAQLTRRIGAVLERLDVIEIELVVKNTKLLGLKKGKNLNVDPPKRYDRNREGLKKFLT